MAKGYHHITRDIPCQIYVLKSSGCSMRDMARKLTFNVSTISRKIERNSGNRSYRLNQADSKAETRRSAASTKPYTMTFDNGKEFAQHRNIAVALNSFCYFATPHAWERGFNEHTNGLVRQYLPKSTDLSKVTDELLERIEDLLNHRPRKALNYKTPFEVFFR